MNTRGITARNSAPFWFDKAPVAAVYMPSGNTIDQYSSRSDRGIRCTTWRQIRSVVSSGIHQVAVAQNSTVAASIVWASPFTSGLAPAIDNMLAPARVVIAAGPMLIQ